MWIVSRRRYDMDLGAERAEASRLRAERDTARVDRDANLTAAATSARQFAETDAALTRVNGRVSRLAGLLADRDLVPAWRLHIARTAAARLLAAYGGEQARADGLQARLDDACGLNHPAVLNGQGWQGRRQDKPTAKETTS